jgi:hypothetical protein
VAGEKANFCLGFGSANEHSRREQRKGNGEFHRPAGSAAHARNQEKLKPLAQSVAWFRRDSSEVVFAKSGAMQDNRRRHTKMPRSAAIVILAFVFSVMHEPASALDVFNYSGPTNDRFSGGYPSAPVANTSSSFIGADYNWSGVGWSAGNSSQSVALITPQNFVAASHFEPAVGTMLRFFGSDGALHSYEVSGYSSISFNGGTDDLAIGTLTAAISAADHVTYYPVLVLPFLSDYLNRNLLVYGFNGNGGTSTVVGTNTYDDFGAINLNGGTLNDAVFQTTFDSVTGETQGQIGDSGGPTFTVFNGSLTVVGVHSAISNDHLHTFDSFIPSFISQIDSILTTHGGFAVAVVPEPAASSLFGGLAAVVGAWIVRRRLKS